MEPVFMTLGQATATAAGAKYQILPKEDPTGADAQLAADDGAWDVDDVAQGIVEKLIRRHPHVFGDVEVAGADEVLVNWERIKAEEKGHKPLEDDIPASLPALARASKVQRRAAGWPRTGSRSRPTTSSPMRLRRRRSAGC